MEKDQTFGSGLYLCVAACLPHTTFEENNTVLRFCLTIIGDHQLQIQRHQVYESHGTFMSLNLDKIIVEIAEMKIVTRWIILDWIGCILNPSK